jgi:cytoskeletal protein RodZ
MENFGAYLKTHREKKSIRLEEIASITKIHLHSLELLETSQWDQLPPEPFIRGFIIAYAKYVGLEPKEVLERYYDETGRKRAATSQLVENRPAERPASSPQSTDTPSELIAQGTGFAPSTKIVVAASIVAVAAVVTLLISVGKRADHPSVDTVQVNTASASPEAGAPAGESGTSDQGPMRLGETMHASPPAAKTGEDRSVALASASPADVAKPAAPTPHQVVIEGKERTWVKVVVDDEAPKEFFLSEGEKATYSAKSKIKVVLGNSTGSRVLYNGKPMDGAKFMGTIRSYKFPANAKFPQDSPSKRESAAAQQAAESENGDVMSPE